MCHLRKLLMSAMPLSSLSSVLMTQRDGLWTLSTFKTFVYLHGPYGFIWCSKTKMTSDLHWNKRNGIILDSAGPLCKCPDLQTAPPSLLQNNLLPPHLPLPFTLSLFSNPSLSDNTSSERDGGLKRRVNFQEVYAADLTCQTHGASVQPATVCYAGKLSTITGKPFHIYCIVYEVIQRQFSWKRSNT